MPVSMTPIRTPRPVTPRSVHEASALVSWAAPALAGVLGTISEIWVTSARAATTRRAAGSAVRPSPGTALVTTKVVTAFGSATFAAAEIDDARPVMTERWAATAALTRPAGWPLARAVWKTSAAPATASCMKTVCWAEPELSAGWRTAVRSIRLL